MAGHRTLTYRDTDQAMRFAEQGDHDEEILGVDNPEFYLTKTFGVYRAALPHLSDRDFTSFRDAEDALIARIDGGISEDENDEFDLAEDEDFEDEVDETVSAEDEDFEDEVDETVSAEDEDFEGSDADDTAIAEATPEVESVISKASPVPPAVPASPGDAIAPPVAISSRRAVIITNGVNDRDEGEVRKATSWKDTTRSATQFLRHANGTPPLRPMKRPVVI